MVKYICCIILFLAAVLVSIKLAISLHLSFIPDPDATLIKKLGPESVYYSLLSIDDIRNKLSNSEWDYADNGNLSNTKFGSFSIGESKKNSLFHLQRYYEVIEFNNASQKNN